ncbi:hypothetical protein DIS16_12120 [Levilactobacillus brevis]|uniref:hypothetical protein n=1 Tax=Levilactobacillus brevis TaxID=1580 RepID=UPI00111E7F06|nr:hypothetical protein [Levilactobacillus brevis]TOY74740.1 hypothetical protein DIS16_12120 [Levilactobacillus brevis]
MPERHSTNHLYAADEPELVIAPAVHYVSIEGSGSPGTDEFYRKKRILTVIARILQKNEVEPAIELQYWYPESLVKVGIADFYSINPISSLQYRVLAALTNEVTAEEIADARATITNIDNHKSDIVVPYSTAEYLAVQVMHHGPFSEELDTLEQLENLARSYNLQRSGPHLEIHLDAFERDTDQTPLRTILRDPVG